MNYILYNKDNYVKYWALRVFITVAWKSQYVKTLFENKTKNREKK